MKLLNGDCLELMKDIPSGSVDLVLTDPPYGTTACKWDSVIPFEPMWEQLNRIIKPNGAICLFGSEPFSSALRMSNIKNFKYDWIWNKKKGGNPLLSKIQPIKITENISVFGKNKVNYYPIMTERDKPKNRGKNTGKKVKRQTMLGLKTKHIHIYIQKTLLSFQMLHKKGSYTRHKNRLPCLNIL